MGYVGQGFVNVPIGDKAAIRLVGWTKHEPGFIDNVRSTRVFPVSGIALDNSARVEDNYNDWTKTGARIALGIDLSDNWTLTPTVMAQRTKSHGAFAHFRGELHLVRHDSVLSGVGASSKPWAIQSRCRNGWSRCRNWRK